MEHILVVDDESSIVTVIQDRLEREGFSVFAVASGEEALARMDAHPADLIVLDLMLPGIDGLEVLRRLRGAGSSIPIVVLTARDEDVDKIVGLEMGADDYLSKPFNPRELSARIRAILRRQAEIKALEARLSQSEAGTNDTEQAGLSQNQDQADTDAGPQPGGQGLEFNHARRRAQFHGQPLTLRPKEYDLLHFLACHREQVFSRTALLSQVWEQDSFIDERTVDVHIRRLRRKLADINPDDQLIFTEWGVGYWLAGDAQ